MEEAERRASRAEGGRRILSPGSLGEVEAVYWEVHFNSGCVGGVRGGEDMVVVCYGEMEERMSCIWLFWKD